MTRNMDESRWVDAGPVLRQQWIEAEGPRQEDTAMSGCKEVVSSTTWDGLTAEMHKPYFGARDWQWTEARAPTQTLHRNYATCAPAMFRKVTPPPSGTKDHMLRGVEHLLCAAGVGH